MHKRTSQSIACLALFLASRSVCAADTLPGSRESLFADDEPAAEQPSSREAPSGDGEAPQPGAAEPPPGRESLFAGDESPPPSAAAAPPSLPPVNVKGFVQNVMAWDWKDPAHWSEMMTRFDVSAQGHLSSNVKWKLGARIDYDATYT
ncbi:MAG: hypothetical protein KA223_08325, partial [Candidatus Accumulibacter sp.]|nr:hypothetical protein [Accumulibacter sp.]